jgi:hypothetical protein
MKATKVVVFEYASDPFEKDSVIQDEFNDKLKKWQETPSAKFLKKHITAPFIIEYSFDYSSYRTKYKVFAKLDERGLLIWRLTY